MKKPWTMTAKAGGELEILLYEQIGADFWTGEGTTAKQFAEDLKAAGAVSRIRLRVSSVGGNVMDGLAMYQTLLSHGATVTAQVDGLAASIASVIIMAASRIDIGESSLVMIHNPSTLVAGDERDMLSMVETLRTVKQSMIKAYRRHSPKSEEEIGKLMDAETWFSGSEAVEAGFADRVIDDDKSANVAAAALASPIVARFFHPPARIAAIAARCAPDDEDERRRRRRLTEIHTQAHDDFLAEMRTLRLETIGLQVHAINARAVPEASEDLQHRRTIARHDRELQEMHAAELAKLGIDEEEWRRRTTAANAKEMRERGWAPPVVDGRLLVPLTGAAGNRYTHE
jgi:ATP-dependent Clp protease protease subunit